MKSARCFSMAVLGFIAVASTLRADDPPLTSPPDDDPNIRFDPDGVPLNITQKKAAPPTQEQLAAYRKQQEQAVLDKDWMLRAYEQQLKTHQATSSQQDQAANPYQEISSDKDLAKLAGLQSFESEDNSKLTYRLSNSSSSQGTAALRPGSAMPKNAASPFGSSFMKPMITPLAGTDSSNLDSFFGSPKGVGTSTYGSDNPPPSAMPASLPRVSAVHDDVDNEVESPGAIAAGKDAVTDPATTDLTLDMLPGESIEHAKAHQDNDSALQLPIMMDAEELHREQTAALTPPAPKTADGVANKNDTAAAAPVKQPLPDYNVPVPAAQYPVITPVHAAIANPYDILNR